MRVAYAAARRARRGAAGTIRHTPQVPSEKRQDTHASAITLRTQLYARWMSTTGVKTQETLKRRGAYSGERRVSLKCVVSKYSQPFHVPIRCCLVVDI